MLVGNVFLVRGDARALAFVAQLLEGESVSMEGNPDVYVRSYTHFGIDEAREIGSRAYARSVGGVRRVFVVQTPVITNEAQNALLKTLEEAPGNAAFFIIVPSPETLLATVRSRAQILDGASVAESVLDVRIFLKSSPRERIEMLKPLLEKNDDDRRDTGGIITFLSSLERMLGTMRNARDGLDAVYRARKYAGDKGSLLKPLLEQVALLCPVH